MQCFKNVIRIYPRALDIIMNIDHTFCNMGMGIGMGSSNISTTNAASNHQQQASSIYPMGDKQGFINLYSYIP